MIANIGRTLVVSLGLASIASTALAQGNTFNPYGNSGYSDYREFGNPMYSNNPALPGQSVLNSKPLISRPRANSFQDYANELDGGDSSSNAARRGASGNLPYYEAYRRLNSDFDRVYKPNNTPEDRLFYERQRQREQKYAQAIRETDPAKRAKLLREVEQDTLDRPAATRTATTKGATPPKPGAGGSTAAAARTPAPAERRQPAPSPFSSDRSGSNRSAATRAPAPPTGRSTTAPPATTTRPVSPRTRTAPDPSTVPVPPPR